MRRVGHSRRGIAGRVVQKLPHLGLSQLRLPAERQIGLERRHLFKRRRPRGALGAIRRGEQRLGEPLPDGGALLRQQLHRSPAAQGRGEEQTEPLGDLAALRLLQAGEPLLQCGPPEVAAHRGDLRQRVGHPARQSRRKRRAWEGEQLQRPLGIDRREGQTQGEGQHLQQRIVGMARLGTGGGQPMPAQRHVQRRSGGDQHSGVQRVGSGQGRSQRVGGLQRPRAAKELKRAVAGEPADAHASAVQVGGRDPRLNGRGAPEQGSPGLQRVEQPREQGRGPVGVRVRGEALEGRWPALRGVRHRPQAILDATGDLGADRPKLVEADRAEGATIPAVEDQQVAPLEDPARHRDGIHLGGAGPKAGLLASRPRDVSHPEGLRHRGASQPIGRLQEAHQPAEPHPGFADRRFPGVAQGPWPGSAAEVRIEVDAHDNRVHPRRVSAGHGSATRFVRPGSVAAPRSPSWPTLQTSGIASTGPSAPWLPDIGSWLRSGPGLGRPPARA